MDNIAELNVFVALELLTLAFQVVMTVRLMATFLVKGASPSGRWLTLLRYHSCYFGSKSCHSRRIPGNTMYESSLSLCRRKLGSILESQSLGSSSWLLSYCIQVS